MVPITGFLFRGVVLYWLQTICDLEHAVSRDEL